MSVIHGTEKYSIKDAPLNKVQQASVKLMINDLRLFTTLLLNKEQINANCYIALMPYMGLIIDGIEDWINAYNNSSKHKLRLPTFETDEQIYYAEMRNSIKLFEKGFLELNKIIKENYAHSDEHFSSICKPIAKHFQLYDIYGVFYCNSIPCDNTILDQIVTPSFSFGEKLGENIKKMAVIGGEYIACFDAFEPYNINAEAIFSSKDYGGIVKSPFGNKYNYKFLLFSILCQINFIVYAIDKFIVDETSTKLRFAYILYYYLLKFLPDMKKHLNIDIIINNKYFLDKFRNAMAHYKLGVALKENEMIDSDIMFGLTQKYFFEDYTTVKNNIITELDNAGKQIQHIIKLVY